MIDELKINRSELNQKVREWFEEWWVMNRTTLSELMTAEELRHIGLIMARVRVLDNGSFAPPPGTEITFNLLRFGDASRPGGKLDKWLSQKIVEEFQNDLRMNLG